jgi:hypothetical protein
MAEPAAICFAAASSAAAIFIQCLVIASQCCLANSKGAASANCLQSAAFRRNSSNFESMVGSLVEDYATVHFRDETTIFSL